MTFDVTSPKDVYIISLSNLNIGVPDKVHPETHHMNQIRYLRF